MDNKVKVFIGILAVSIIGLLIFRKAFLNKSEAFEPHQVEFRESVPLTPVG